MISILSIGKIVTIHYMNFPPIGFDFSYLTKAICMPIIIASLPQFSQSISRACGAGQHTSQLVHDFYDSNPKPDFIPFFVSLQKFF